MPAAKLPEGARSVFIDSKDRHCVACNTPLRYEYKSSGRWIWRLDGLRFVEVQIAHCPNGRCQLVRKGIHPAEEWGLAPAFERFGTDVIAMCGSLRYKDGLTRAQIAARLRTEYKLPIAERTVNRLYKLYGELVAGAHLRNPEVIRQLKRRRVMVLALDGAEPIKGREPVWFVREATSGLVLAGQALQSCTAEDIADLLRPIKAFAAKHEIRIVGIVSDAEENIRSAVATVFPGVPHQLCQLHYIKNVAKPLAAEDRALRQELKTGARGLRQIERDIRAATQPEGELTEVEAGALLDICTAIRSVLKDNANPPFQPPGLKLFDRLLEWQKTLAEMAREKGGES